MQKKALAVAIAGALAVPTAAQAVDYKISGQVNRGFMYLDDGVGTDFQFVDNDNSSTRFRFKGSEKIGRGLTAGFLWEVQMESNSSATVTVKQAGDGPGPVTFTERHIAAFFDGRWGKVTLGQTDGAANGTVERDLSGTTVVALNSRQTVGGAIAFKSKNVFNPNLTDSAGRTVTIGTAYNHFDGLSRYDLVRYDTPTIGPGIVLSASVGGNDRFEGSGSIRTGLFGGKLDAALFYGSDKQRTNTEQYGGSLSFLFAQGFSISGHAASRSYKGKTTGGRNSLRSDSNNTWGIKGGYKWGNNAVGIDFSQANDAVLVGQNAADLAAGGFAGNYQGELNTFGLSYVYTLPKPKVELYAGWRLWSLDSLPIQQMGTPGSTEDVNTVLAGTRIKF